MPDQTKEQSRGARALSPEAVQTARELAAEVRSVAASLPFGSDPAAFAAALERLAAEDEPTEALPGS